LLPVLAYWISRTIMLANRGEMHDDPIVFAFGDPASLAVGLAAWPWWWDRYDGSLAPAPPIARTNHALHLLIR